jgi:YbgC/YbaW family acyl-CoA thioester hydrolase
MEAAEVEFLRSLGLSVSLVWEGQALGFPRVSASCDYLRPARFEEVLDVAVTLERLGSKSATYAFEFARNGEIIAHGKVSSVCCRVREDGQLESVEIPETIRARLKAITANADE